MKYSKNPLIYLLFHSVYFLTFGLWKVKTLHKACIGEIRKRKEDIHC